MSSFQPKVKTYSNGWSACLDKSGMFYAAIVRNARGDIQDKVRCDNCRDARTYFRAFCKIAKAS